MTRERTTLELCAGAGGTALGVAAAGFRHVALVDNDAHACQTLRLNRPDWKDLVVEKSIFAFSAAPHKGVDLLSAGVPCPPFSKAGRQLGKADERDLFPRALDLIAECEPRAVMFENVRGLMDKVFDDYRASIDGRLRSMGLFPRWTLVNSSDFGVPQLRPRTVCVALCRDAAAHFEWPPQTTTTPPTVGQVLEREMASRGWPGAPKWAAGADRIAPTLVGGSKKHGGPDLGPTRAKKEWARLGVDALQLANEPPGPEFTGMPRLTARMAALLQGFPPEWEFAGKKTPAYRQVGNAFPPPVAEAIARAIRAALDRADELAAKEPITAAV